MSRGFRISARVDEDQHLIVFNISGDIDSQALIDKWIETYASLAEPWLYDRLLDYRRSDGLVAVNELERFAVWWEDRTRGINYSLKAAIIVNNPLDARRVHTVNGLFPHDIRESFDSLDDALTWLQEDTAKRACG
ncbi:MAG: hypothetical protein NVV72_17305 [Asticcacaulis sp.]|nr:hypothetical protein [Asticcacaulis sp.]